MTSMTTPRTGKSVTDGLGRIFSLKSHGRQKGDTP